MNRVIGLFLTLAVLVSGHNPAGADLIFTTLEGVSATGINDAGQIVGGYSAGGFLYSGGTYTTINVPGGAPGIP